MPDERSDTQRATQARTGADKPIIRPQVIAALILIVAAMLVSGWLAFRSYASPEGTPSSVSAPSGTIVIQKQTIPSTSVGFNFYDDIPSSGGFKLSAGSQKILSNLPAGSYTVGELNPGPRWKLVNLQCDDPDGQTTTSVSQRNAKIDLDSGETVTCVFVNDRQSGTIEIEKYTVPAGGTGFSFTHDIPGHGSFTLDDGEKKVFSAVTVGSYEIVMEDASPHYAWEGIWCQDPDEGTYGHYGLNTVFIDLDDNETVQCVLVSNRQAGTIVVEKYSNPGGGTGFDFTDNIPGSGGFSLDDTERVTFSDVLVGTYQVTEADQDPAYVLNYLACDDPDAGSSGHYGTRTATIDLDDDETVTCVFVNDGQAGTIVIEKFTVPGGGTGFEFTDNIPGSGSFALGDGGSKTFSNIPAGTYQVSEEDLGPRYLLTNLLCSDPDGGSWGTFGTQSAIIDLDDGETVTCTFVNEEQEVSEVYLPVVLNK